MESEGRAHRDEAFGRIRRGAARKGRAHRFEEWQALYGTAVAAQKVAPTEGGAGREVWHLHSGVGLFAAEDLTRDSEEEEIANPVSRGG